MRKGFLPLLLIFSLATYSLYFWNLVSRPSIKISLISFQNISKNLPILQVREKSVHNLAVSELDAAKIRVEQINAWEEWKKPSKKKEELPQFFSAQVKEISIRSEKMAVVQPDDRLMVDRKSVV